MQKFANSKLYKRVLVFALVACMLCSVLVAGIGTGITAKAETTTEPIKAQLWCATASWWPNANAEKTISADGTYTISGTLANGTGLGNCQLEIVDLDHTVDPTAVTISNVSLTISGSDVALAEGYSKEDSAKGGLYWTYAIADVAAYADTTWNNTEIKFTFTVSGIELKEVEVEETPVESETDTSGSDAGSDTADIDWTIKTADSGYTAYVVYCDASWGNGKWNPDGVGDAKVNGDGTYSVYYKAPASPVSGAMVFTVDIVDVISAMEDAGVSPSDVTVSNVKVWVDGKAIDVDQSKVVYGHIEANKNNYRIEIYNPGGGGVTGSNSPIDAAELNAVYQQVKVEFTLSGIGSLEGSSSEPAEEEDEGLKGTTGSKKENGYVHDKGAIFVYTGDKDINDFTIATGWAFGAVHEINDKWGDSYFGEGGMAGVGTNEGTTIKGNGIYIKYWEDYRGIGYPAIQLSWDTDRIFYLGQLTIYSSDWSTQALFGSADGFYRGPAERYAGTGEALLDGSNRWYYFGEGSYTAASTTTTEDTTTEDVGYDTSKWADLEDSYTNEVLTYGEGEGAAYIMYADESWTNQYWHDGSATAFKAEDVVIKGEGDYVVGLSCKNPSKGIAFTALGIKGGEAAFPEYCFTITAMTVNGKLINYTKPYTSSDDAIETRSNIYNTWVTELPEDARVAYGDLEGCLPTIVEATDFASVNEFKVYFTVTAPETEFDYDAKVVETLTNLVNDGTLTQEEVDQYIIDNEIVVPEA